MADYEVLTLNEATPQIIAPGAGNRYLFPRDAVTATGVLVSSVADGASAVGFTLTTAAMSTSGAKLLSVKNNTTAGFGITKDFGIHVLQVAMTPHSQSMNLCFGNNVAKGATGQYSAAFGWNPLASGANSFCAGTDTTASGASSTAFGSSATASGDYSFACGNAATVAGNYAATFGRGGGTLAQSNRCTLAMMGGSYAMGASSVLSKQTTNATPAELLCNDTSFVIPADSAWCFSALIVARSDETDGNVCAVYKIEGGIKRDESSNTSLIGSVAVTTIAEDADAASGGWDVTASANDTNETLAITVTGEASTNINWSAYVTYASVLLA